MNYDKIKSLERERFDNQQVVPDKAIFPDSLILKEECSL